MIDTKNYNILIPPKQFVPVSILFLSDNVKLRRSNTNFWSEKLAPSNNIEEDKDKSIMTCQKELSDMKKNKISKKSNSNKTKTNYLNIINCKRGKAELALLNLILIKTRHYIL